MGKNIVGTMRAETYNSGTYSSSLSEGGGGTSFCKLGRGRGMLASGEEGGSRGTASVGKTTC